MALRLLNIIRRISALSTFLRINARKTSVPAVPVHTENIRPAGTPDSFAPQHRERTNPKPHPRTLPLHTRKSSFAWANTNCLEWERDGSFFFFSPFPRFPAIEPHVPYGIRPHDTTSCFSAEFAPMNICNRETMPIKVGEHVPSLRR